MSLVSIVIPVKDNWEYTELCLESIFKYTEPPYEVVLVDNGSRTSWWEELLKLKNEHPEVDLKYIRSEVNLGFAGGCNRGIELSRGDFVVILNNDTIVTPGWLPGLLRVFEKEPKMGITGPRSNYVAGPQMVRDCPLYFKNPSEVDLEKLSLYSESFKREKEGQYVKQDYVIGLCMCIKREVIEAIGGFDERFFPGNFEDDDFCLRAKLCGFEIAIACDTFLYHFGEKTFEGERFDYKRTLLENLKRFIEKWGIDQVHYKSDLYRKVLERRLIPEDKLVFPLFKEKPSLLLEWNQKGEHILSYLVKHLRLKSLPLILLTKEEPEKVITKVEELLKNLHVLDDPDIDITIFQGELSEVLNGLKGKFYLFQKLESENFIQPQQPQVIRVFI